MVLVDPSDLPGEAEVETVVGRTPKESFTQVYDWVLFADIPTQAKTLYWALTAHVNSTRAASGDRVVWPTMDTLAAITGLKRYDKVKRYEDALVAIGAIEVSTFRTHNGMRRRKKYVVHEVPPAGHVGPTSLASFYAGRHTADDNQAGPDTP